MYKQCVHLQKQRKKTLRLQELRQISVFNHHISNPALTRFAIAIPRQLSKPLKNLKIELLHTEFAICIHSSTDPVAANRVPRIAASGPIPEPQGDSIQLATGFFVFRFYQKEAPRTIANSRCHKLP